MKFMLLQHYTEPESHCPPMEEWSPADVEAHIRFQQVLNEQLLASGELLDAHGLAGPEAAKFVVWKGEGSPVITDGPFIESKEFLAGYRLIDVESEARALEIAAQASAAPSPVGPIGQRIEVRRAMGSPDDLS
jgi:hypothetical protein